MFLHRFRRYLALAICPDLAPRVPGALERLVQWPSDYRPDWWGDDDVREFILWARGKMSRAACYRMMHKMGDDHRYPSKSALYRFWELEGPIEERPRPFDAPVAVPVTLPMRDLSREIYPPAPYPYGAAQPTTGRVS